MNRFISSLFFNDKSYFYYDLKKVSEKYPALKKLPNTLKILLEMNLQYLEEEISQKEIIDLFLSRNTLRKIKFYPNRVVLGEDNGSALLVLLSSMEEYLKKNISEDSEIKPEIIIDILLNETSLETKDIKKNEEKYKFFKWANSKFDNLTIFPPSMCSSKLNLEQLSTMVNVKEKDKNIFLRPEILISSDNSVESINALGIIGLKINQIELEKIILGMDLTFSFPKVIGVEITGSFAQGLSIYDLIFYLDNVFSKYDLTDKIIEFYGTGLKNINVKARTLICEKLNKNNALFFYFNIDSLTMQYLEKTRGVDTFLIKDYYLKLDIYENNFELEYDENIKIDLLNIKPILYNLKNANIAIEASQMPSKIDSYKKGHFLKDNDIVFCSINNTDLVSLIQCALVLKKAKILQLKISENIKRVLIINDFNKSYLQRIDLLKYFEYYNFSLSNLSDGVISERNLIDIQRYNLNVCALFTNENDFNKLNQDNINLNYCVSPLLLIAYCLKANINIDITIESIYHDIYLSDLSPSFIEIEEFIQKIDNQFYINLYKSIYSGNEYWQNISYENKETFAWDNNFTYIQPYEINIKDKKDLIDIKDGKILALLGNNIGKDEFLCEGQISVFSQVSMYLKEKQVLPDEYNTLEVRKSNSNIMKRTILTYPKLKNKVLPLKEGGFTKDFQKEEILTFFDFSLINKGKSLIIFAGKNFGYNVDNDWASKALVMLGVEVVVAKSFDLKYKNNLISVGILPLEFLGDDIEFLNLKGDEKIVINSEITKNNERIKINIVNKRAEKSIIVKAIFDKTEDIEYFKNGGFINLHLKKYF